MNAPRPDIFDPGNAAVLCAFSAAAYAPAAEGATIDDNATDTRVVLTRRDDNLIIAFRGTADLRNWLTDLDYELTRAGNFRVHRGFHEAVSAVQSDVSAKLGDARETRLWVTGHSLGGALAMLWALWAARRGHEIAGVYTFGQPRVGDAAFSHLYNSKLKTRTWRSVHADDIVPRVPWLLGRYRHAGHEVFLGSMKPSSRILDPSILARLPSDLLHAARELRRGKVALLADHRVHAYLALFPETIPSAARAAAFQQP
jgi:hypothetical protein